MFLLLPIAFISGILTVFSPCIIPILPVVLASGADGKVWRIRGLILGLIISFSLATLLLAFIVQILGISADTIRNLAVFILVIFGLSLVFPVIWDKIQGLIERYWRFKPVQTQKEGFGGGFITGVSLGIVWTPCVGPILAAVATLAALNSLSINTVLIITVYALGAGLGLYILAKGGAKASEKLGFIKSNNITIRRIFGIVILLTALFIFAGLDRKVQALTLKYLPEGLVNITTTFETMLGVDDRIGGLGGFDSGEKPKKGSVVVKSVNVTNDFNGAKVERSDLLMGCFGQDCIPSIDDPKFETASQADSWLNPDDIVFAVDIKGAKKAYPQRILNWHEIVNDDLGGTPAAITFCPLCGSALAFERTVDGIITEFGVSGRLHNNDLVMYDRYEGNMWQQITGEGIVGPAARRDEVLKQIPIITTTWESWKKENPKTQVLSRDTGHSRDYDRSPYGTYEENDELLFGVKDLDESLQIKTPVYGIEVGNASKAYTQSALEKEKIIEDTLGGVNVRLERSESGEVRVTNLDTNEEIIPIRLFWFAWASFHPGTELYK